MPVVDAVLKDSSLLGKLSDSMKWRVANGIKHHFKPQIFILYIYIYIFYLYIYNYIYTYSIYIYIRDKLI